MSEQHLLEDFLESYTKDVVKTSYKSQIKKYLEWRKKTLKEIIENGLAEEDFFEKYLEDTSIKTNENTRITRILAMKQLLRFYGIPFEKFAKRKKDLFFINDPAMKNFLLFVGLARNTQREANRAIYYYCRYRNKSPTELLTEAKEKTINEIRIEMMKYYRSLGEIKSAWKFVNYVKRFYESLAAMTIILPKQDRSVKKLRLKEVLVDKDLVRELIAAADIRDSMIIFAIFESGINPVDLVSLNYYDFYVKDGDDNILLDEKGNKRHFLKLYDPDSIDYIAVIKHVRQKTKYEFLACFGPQTLKFMSKWLIQRKIGSIGWKEEINDQSPIFTAKRAPYNRLNSGSISEVLRRLTKAVNVEIVTSEDFRNSFNTRSKTMLKHYDKEIFLGHTGGIERHYDISDIEYFTNEYYKAWKILFDLTFDSEKMDSLEEDSLKMKEELFELREANALYGKVILQLLEAQKGNPIVIEEETLEKLKQPRKKEKRD